MAHDTPLSRFPTLANESPDAELLRLGQEHDAAFARIVAVNTQPDDYDEGNVSAICAAQADLEFAIQEIPAQTWEGVVVKARIAAEYTDRCSLGRILDDILPSLIEDILRIADVAPKRTARRCEEEGSDHGVALPAAPAAPAPTQAPDPVYETIAQCRAAFDAYGEAVMKQSSLGFPACDEPSPEKDAAREACNAWVKAWKNILVVVPTTVAGVAALATFMAEHSQESGGLETPERTLNELALSLQAFATGAGQDGRHA